MNQNPVQVRSHQRFSTVVRAELRRHLSSRRHLVRLALIAAAGLLAGMGALAFVASFDPEGAAATGGSVPTAMETAGGVVAILLGLSALGAAAAETSDGTVLSSLLLVPDRRRLLAARAVAPMVIGEVTALTAAGAVLAGGLAMSGGSRIDLGVVALSLLAIAVAAPLTALLGFLTGTLVRRGAPAMAIAMFALLVLPLAVGAAQLAAPPALGPALGYALQATPGVAVLQSLSVSAANQGPVPVALTGLAVLAGWVAIVAVGASAQFRREGQTA